jgi:hypothetical protein
MENSISTENFDATITSSSYNTSNQSFQVQVYILIKQNFPSLNRGDVIIINSLYDSPSKVIQTSMQYQVTPNSIKQTNQSSDKSRHRKPSKTSDQVLCKNLSDNVYVCYNTNKSRK